MQKIVYIAENNVELWELKETKTATDKSTFEVWEKVKSYGETVVADEVKQIDAQIEELNPAKMQDKISKLQEQKAVLAEVAVLVEESKTSDTVRA